MLLWVSTILRRLLTALYNLIKLEFLTFLCWEVLLIQSQHFSLLILYIGKWPNFCWPRKIIKSQYLLRIRIFAFSTEMNKLTDIREVRLGPKNPGLQRQSCTSKTLIQRNLRNLSWNFERSLRLSWLGWNSFLLYSKFTRNSRNLLWNFERLIKLS